MFLSSVILISVALLKSAHKFRGWSPSLPTVSDVAVVLACPCPVAVLCNPTTELSAGMSSPPVVPNSKGAFSSAAPCTYSFLLITGALSPILNVIASPFCCPGSAVVK